MRFPLIATAAALALALPAWADSHAAAPGYTALDLLSPCTEADNDARWGEAAETECEQYIVGFVGGLMATGMAGAGTEVCPPEQNMADEVRWAFMRWVHGSYTKRKAMAASDAMLMTLKENFACGG